MCFSSVNMYTKLVPKLWSETIEAHRREVQQAILQAAAALVGEHGLHSVTMSEIAEVAGIGRATLYKYFRDVEAILVAWHDRLIAGHLERLAEVRDRAGDGGERVGAVLQAYALMTYERPRGTELAALMHRGEHHDKAEVRLSEFIRDLLTEAARTGDVRDDVAPHELGNYCLHALDAASSLDSPAAVGRLVTVTMAGLRPC